MGGAKEQNKQSSSHHVSLWDVTDDDFDLMYSAEMATVRVWVVLRARTLGEPLTSFLQYRAMIYGPAHPLLS